MAMAATAAPGYHATEDDHLQNISGENEEQLLLHEIQFDLNEEETWQTDEVILESLTHILTYYRLIL